MSIRTKLSLGLLFLFLGILLTGGLGMWYLHQLSTDTKRITQDNYESLEYMQQMLSQLDASHKTDLKQLESILKAQENNITEVGEKEATRQLRRSFEAFKTDTTSGRILSINQAIRSVTDLNLHAIVRKSQEAQQTATKATNVLSVVLIIVFLVSFTFIVNFPGYVANPIRQLTEGLREITNKNYSQRLHLKSSDELGELGAAFNLMAEKLDVYEHSNVARLMFEKKRIDAIINNMSDAIVGLDNKNNILFINQIAARLLHLSVNDAVGKYAPDVALKNDLLRTLLQNDLATTPLKIFANNKESYFTQERLHVQNEDESISAGTVIVLKNITQFQELDLAKTNFIATISHELKTPLAAVKMSLKLLEDPRVGSLNAEQQTLVQHLKDDTQRLLNITGELLDLTQIESGKINLHPQRVNAQEIVNYAVQTVQTLADQKKVQLVLTGSPAQSLPELDVDLQKTVWVLVNLLTNAIRYSPENQKVEIGLVGTGEAVQFTVRDFGKGIDEAFQARIFEKFFQVPTAHSDNSGTGLGLAISKDFIEAQGGKIWVESQPDAGSLFGFELKASNALARN